MKPPFDRDADIDLDTLKRILVTPAVRNVHICRLYFCEGCTAREIAEKEEMTESAVRKVIQRARRKLAASSSGTKESRFDPFPQNQC